MIQSLREALVVGLVGVAVASLANALSPRGLSLTRNYFPTARVASATHSPPGHPDAGALVSTNMASTHAVLAHLEAQGLQAIEGAAVEQLFHDPRYAQERIVFVDARNDHAYLEGHIPGAYQLDYYRAEDYLPVVLPACLHAEIVVVYCNGGDCEDSEFTALTLREEGVPAESLRVYLGGMNDWEQSGRPVETGAGGSGILRGGRP
jgi:rhodanese-related sulfurtransferase